jgi:colicin import membrane protein
MDTTTGKQDSQLEAKAPGAEGNAPPVTFTQAQLEEAIQKDRIARGRDEKALKEREAKIAAAEAREAEAKRKADEAEEDKLRDKPNDLKAYRDRRQAEKDREEAAAIKAAAEAEKAANAAAIAEANALKLELAITKTAAEKGVDAEALKAKCARFNLTKAEDVAEMADTMAAKGTNPAPHFDSNKGSGGAVDWSKKTPAERIAEQRRRDAEKK